MRSSILSSQIVLALMLLSTICGCSKHEPKWNPEEGTPIYSVAFRKLPPDPVYNRVRFGYPPETMPVRAAPEVRSNEIMPVIHLQVKNESLENTALILASSMRYRSYVASKVADKPVTLDRLGTLDELAEVLARRMNVRVWVDHGGRTMRILPPEQGTKK